MKPAGPALWGDEFKTVVDAHVDLGYTELVAVLHPEYRAPSRVYVLWWNESADIHAAGEHRSHEDLTLVVTGKMSTTKCHSKSVHPAFKIWVLILKAFLENSSIDSYTASVYLAGSLVSNKGPSVLGGKTIIVAAADAKALKPNLAFSTLPLLLGSLPPAIVSKPLSCCRCQAPNP
eukprot:bmy_17957T0